MKIRKGDYLYKLGDPSKALFIIRTGKVSLSKLEEDRQVELAQLGPGQIVGDLSFFTGAPRTSDAIASTDVECLEVSYDAVRKQFETAPPWVQTMTQTLARQVQSFSSEMKMLKDIDDHMILPRLAIARALSALTFVPFQFGKRSGNELSIDWATLRNYSNIGFREISSSVLQVARVLETLGYCRITAGKDGPTEIVLLNPEMIPEFLKYYVRAIGKNSPELTRVEVIEYTTLQVLAEAKVKKTPIHRGIVEIDLGQFTNYAISIGHPEVTAVSIELLVGYGVEIQKLSSETNVKLRYHQEEISNLAKFWQIVQAFQKVNQTATVPAAS